MTVKRIIAFSFIVFSFALHAENISFEETSIWNKSATELAKELDLEAHPPEGEFTLLKKKEPIVLVGYPFEQIMKFPKNQKLSEITYTFKAPKNELRQACLKVNEYLSNVHGNAHHKKHRIESQGGSDQNFEMIYTWNTKNASLEESCYALNDENIIKISTYPKWELLECVMHSVLNQHAQRYFYYFDEMNQQIRPFEKTKIDSAFPVTLNEEEMTFSNQDKSYQGKLIKATNRISLKMIAPNGQIKILDGFCYKRDNANLHVRQPKNSRQNLTQNENP